MIDYKSNFSSIYSRICALVQVYVVTILKSLSLNQQLLHLLAKFTLPWSQTSWVFSWPSNWLLHEPDPGLWLSNSGPEYSHISFARAACASDPFPPANMHSSSCSLPPLIYFNDGLDGWIAGWVADAHNSIPFPANSSQPHWQKFHFVASEAGEAAVANGLHVAAAEAAGRWTLLCPVRCHIWATLSKTG